jgi:hypothetical protein
MLMLERALWYYLFELEEALCRLYDQQDGSSILFSAVCSWRIGLEDLLG